VTSQVADNGQLNLAPENVTRKTTVKAGKRDTVATIAKRYKLSATQVAEWNDVGASAAFKAGQQVVVYLPVRTSSRASSRMSAKAKSGSSRGSHSSAKRPAKATKKR
jgi:membrane-bound lytic murein transglycosylase D